MSNLTFSSIDWRSRASRVSCTSSSAPTRWDAWSTNFDRSPVAAAECESAAGAGQLDPSSTVLLQLDVRRHTDVERSVDLFGPPEPLDQTPTVTVRTIRHPPLSFEFSDEIPHNSGWHAPGGVRRHLDPGNRAAFRRTV